MPEVEGTNEVSTTLTIADLVQLIRLKIGDRNIQLDNGAWAKCDKYGDIEISFEACVTLEFDLADYAQERDEP